MARKDRKDKRDYFGENTYDDMYGNKGNSKKNKNKPWRKKGKK